MLQFLVLALLNGSPSETIKPLKKDYPIQPVPFTAVHMEDNFWAPRIETNRAVTIPYAFGKCEETDRMFNFEQAAKAMRGELKTVKMAGYPFDDTDVYKVLEGASYALNVKPDPKLDKYLDDLIVKIAAAQEPDGYLYTVRTMSPSKPHDWSGKERWEKEEDLSHELYNLGHLYEAAVAHYQATGKKSLLNVAIKSADLLVKTFGPGKRKIWPGHQIVEMGLAKMYRATGNEEYLKLAKFMLDVRGGSGEYAQAHKPVIDQDEAVGHAVRASYMYSGMADVAALTGDTSYLTAVDKIWENVVSKKLYLTGGIGATGAGEAFGANYELPNMSAYCETCAAIGNDYWNQRLFELHGDSKYVDVFERTLYNGLLSGISLDGKLFFYPNPLESTGQHARSPWFGCACCPGNMTRFIASIPGYMYGVQGSSVYVNLYAGSTANIKLENGQKLELKQVTEYPWKGDIKMTVNPAKSGKFAVKVRIPGWAQNEAVPSDLYKFTDKADQAITLKVNGESVPITQEKGYVTISRTWKKGDTINLDLPMPVRRVEASTNVEADKGRVALQRGPIVYCAEWKDNPGGHVRNILLPDTADLKPEYEANTLGGVTVLRGNAQTVSTGQDGQLTPKDQEFTAIPYYAWANRGRGEMVVWLPNSIKAARALPPTTLATTAKVRTSGGANPGAINDGEFPRSVFEESTFFHWWPKKGTDEWVEYTLEKSSTVSEASVYWFDDTGKGECRMPESWRVMYKDGDTWKPVETTDTYGVEKDKFNKITFKPVTTTALRLEVKLQKQWSGGINEWIIK